MGRYDAVRPAPWGCWPATGVTAPASTQAPIGTDSTTVPSPKRRGLGASAHYTGTHLLIKGKSMLIKKWISGSFIGAYIGALAIAATLPVQTSDAASAEAMPIKVAVRRITEPHSLHTMADDFVP